jgi:Ca2+-binding RTX toxin-like protein
LALGDEPDRVAGGTLAGASALDLAYEGTVSPDVVVNARATLRLDAGEGDNIVSLAGGDGFDAAWASPTSIAGRTGADVIVGGAATDLIFGGDGADRMYGFGGNDLLSAAGAGPDFLDCGEGGDIVLASGPGDSVTGCESRRRRLRPSAERGYPRPLPLQLFR